MRKYIEKKIPKPATRQVNEKIYRGKISQTCYEAGLCDPHFLSLTHRLIIDTKAKWARVKLHRTRDPNMSW